jgi:hypothetical protein
MDPEVIAVGEVSGARAGLQRIDDDVAVLVERDDAAEVGRVAARSNRIRSRSTGLTDQM